MVKRDYYEVIGVTREATFEEIKKVFRSKARNLHPDNKQSGDEAAFKELAEAYEVLCDEQKRSLYDRFGHEGVAGKTHSFDNFDFGSVAGFGLDELLESFFGGGFGGRRSGPEPGSHLQLEIQVDFLEAITGIEKKVTIKRLDECETCNGSGAAPESKVINCSTCNGAGQVQQVINSWFGQSVRVSECPSCQGSGKRIEKPCKKCHGMTLIEKSVEFPIKVPAGIESGTRMRLPGGGDKGRNGGNYGDLFLFVRVKEHDTFVRDGENIFVKQGISFSLAALGGEIIISTVEGEKSLKIPAGTQSGRIMVMKNLGVPRLNNPNKRGDQLVQLNIETPTKLLAEEKKLLERLAELRGESLSEHKNGSGKNSSDKKESEKTDTAKNDFSAAAETDKGDTSIIDKIVDAFKNKQD
jgi:molecular chaperone DnaJ